MMDELNKLMYYGAAPVTFEKAKLLRNKMTPEEISLWEKLKNKQICNVRFRRQHPIGVFIVDFYCHKAKLVIELDGKIHLKRKQYDKERTDILKSCNLEVIRFSNYAINTNINSVTKQIENEVKSRLESNATL